MPSKFFWRQIPTGTSDELGFTVVKRWWQPWMGVFYCVMGACLIYLETELLTGFNGPMFLSAFHPKDFSLLISWFLFCSFPSLVAMQALVLGIWGIFGRFTLRVSLASHSIIITLWLRSVHLFSRRYPVDGITSISLRPARGVWRLLQLLSLRLNYNTSKSRKLLMFSRKFQTDGLKMAGQIADFIGTPLVSESGGQAVKADTPQ